MTPGEAAYIKFREISYIPEDEPLTSWEKLSDANQKGWEEIAKSAVNASFKLQIEKADRRLKEESLGITDSWHD